ncbi:MAG: hypothetical protein M1836_005537 [Candelina mexicana]|nr:MAG: hypothetical protein M1836_005537 [Candelina mexicana]
MSDSMLSSSASLPARYPPPNTPENELEGTNAAHQASIDTIIEPLSVALTSTTPSASSAPDSSKSIRGLFGFIPVKLGSPRAPPDADETMQESTPKGEETSLVSSTTSWVQVQPGSGEAIPIDRFQAASDQDTVRGSQDPEQAIPDDTDWLGELKQRLERIDATQIEQGKKLAEISHMLANSVRGNNIELMSNVRREGGVSSHENQRLKPNVPNSLNLGHEAQCQISSFSQTASLNSGPSLKLTSLSLSNLKPSPPPSPQIYKVANPDSVPATPPFLAIRPQRNRIPSSLDLSLPENKAGVTTAVSWGKGHAERCEDYLANLGRRERERDDGSGRVLRADVFEGWKGKDAKLAVDSGEGEGSKGVVQEAIKEAIGNQHIQRAVTGGVEAGCGVVIGTNGIAEDAFHTDWVLGRLRS